VTRRLGIKQSSAGSNYAHPGEPIFPACNSQFSLAWKMWCT